MKLRKARIVHDNYCGYEAQVWRWWFPFWIQIGINTHPTLELAQTFALKKLSKEVWRNR